MGDIFNTGMYVVTRTHEYIPDYVPELVTYIGRGYMLGAALTNRALLHLAGPVFVHEQEQ